MQINSINSIPQSNIYCNRSYKTKNSKQTKPAFTGLFSFFTNKNTLRATLNSDIAIYSPKELAKLREYATREVVDMFKQAPTPGLIKRMDNILHSPFVDYETAYFGGDCSNLADQIAYHTGSKNDSELYRHFVLTSLSQTMPMELIEKSRKVGLTGSNESLYNILESYSKMDEATPMAAQVRKMVQRLTEAEIPIHNQNYLCAKSILNNQPLMSKTYVDSLGLTPESSIKIIHNEDMPDTNFYTAHSVIGKPKLLRDGSGNSSLFFIVDPEKCKNIPSKSEEASIIFSFYSRNMSLYNLAGLSENKTVREEVFDIIPWIKANRNRHIATRKKYIGKDETLYRTLYTAKTYHPELLELNFLEKYIMSYGGKVDMYDIFSEFPVRYTFSEDGKLLKDTTKRINELKQENSPNNSERIEKLSDFLDYITPNT